MRAKLEITGVLCTVKYGPDGDPLYIVNDQPVARLRVPEALIRRQQIIRRENRPKGLYG